MAKYCFVELKLPLFRLGSDSMVPCEKYASLVTNRFGKGYWVSGSHRSVSKPSWSGVAIALSGRDNCDGSPHWAVNHCHIRSSLLVYFIYLKRQDD